MALIPHKPKDPRTQAPAPEPHTIVFSSPDAAESVIKVLEEEPKSNPKLVRGLIQLRKLIG